MTAQHEKQVSMTDSPHKIGNQERRTLTRRAPVAPDRIKQDPEPSPSLAFSAFRHIAGRRRRKLDEEARVPEPSRLQVGVPRFSLFGGQRGGWGERRRDETRQLVRRRDLGARTLLGIQHDSSVV